MISPRMIQRLQQTSPILMIPKRAVKQVAIRSTNKLRIIEETRTQIPIQKLFKKRTAYIPKAYIQSLSRQTFSVAVHTQLKPAAAFSSAADNRSKD